MFDLDTEIRLLNQSGDGRGRVRRDCDCRVPVPSWTREVEGRLAPSSAEQRVCRWSFRSATGSPTRKANGSSFAGTSAHTARPTCRSAERRDVFACGDSAGDPPNADVEPGRLTKRSTSCKSSGPGVTVG